MLISFTAMSMVGGPDQLTQAAFVSILSVSLFQQNVELLPAYFNISIPCTLRMSCIELSMQVVI